MCVSVRRPFFVDFDCLISVLFFSFALRVEDENSNTKNTNTHTNRREKTKKRKLERRWQAKEKKKLTHVLLVDDEINGALFLLVFL